MVSISNKYAAQVTVLMAQVLGLLLILMWGEVSAVVMITVAAMVSITLLGEWAIVTETPTAMAN